MDLDPRNSSSDPPESGSLPSASGGENNGGDGGGDGSGGTLIDDEPYDAPYPEYESYSDWNVALGSRMLGATVYGPDDVEFSIFAPQASEARVEGDFGIVHLNKDENGVFSSRTLVPQADGREYTFIIDGDQVQDPYARLADDHRGQNVIVDPVFTWSDSAFSRPDRQSLVIYEMHVSDFTRDPESGAHAAERGKFPGLLSRIDHLKRLGVNAVELMPISEHQSDDYSWGYNPALFFAPESSLASAERAQVKEFKELVNALHREEIAVLLDVVYNHVSGQDDDNPFYDIDANYYFDHDGDGDLADDATPWGYRFANQKSMGKKLVYDNLRMWMEEFHIDGFRIDSTENMNLEALLEVIVALEEDGFGDRLYLFEEFKFEHNERIRELNFARSSPLISSWGTGYKNKIWGLFTEGYCACSSLDEPSQHSFTDGWENPLEVVHYHSSHDEGTLRGRFGVTVEQARVAATQLLTSSGIPMLWMGEEFQRLHYGNHHPSGSNLAPENNVVHWRDASDNEELIEFYSTLVHLRLHLDSLKATTQRHYHHADSQTLAFTAVSDDKTEATIVLLNHTNQERTFNNIPVAPVGTYVIHVDGELATTSVNGLGTVDLGEFASFTLPPRSSKILVSQ